MEQVRGFQFRRPVSDPFGIDQQREHDAGLLAEPAGIIHVAQPDRRQRGSGLLKFELVCAQLRDMLAAEDSAVVPQKNNYGRGALPQRANADITAARFRQHYIRKFRAERLRHALIVSNDACIE